MLKFSIGFSVAFHNDQAGFEVLTRVLRDVFHAPAVRLRIRKYRKTQKRPARGQHDLCDEFACPDAQIEAVEPAYLQ